MAILSDRICETTLLKRRITSNFEFWKFSPLQNVPFEILFWILVNFKHMNCRWSSQFQRFLINILSIDMQQRLSLIDNLPRTSELPFGADDTGAWAAHGREVRRGRPSHRRDARRAVRRRPGCACPSPWRSSAGLRHAPWAPGRDRGPPPAVGPTAASGNSCAHANYYHTHARARQNSCMCAYKGWAKVGVAPLRENTCSRELKNDSFFICVAFHSILCSQNLADKASAWTHFYSSIYLTLVTL